MILLLILRDTLAVAPGDEYDGCEVPDYPVNIKVLMDSWRYQTLLAQNDATNTGTTAVWTTDGSGGNVVSNKERTHTVKYIIMCSLY